MILNVKLSITVICLPLLSSAQLLLEENFESDLALWEHKDPGIAKIIKTEDESHKSVLQLTPNKTAECILVKGSDKWEKVVITGEALFPTDKHDYLGLVYNYNKNDRADFGCIYIKGKGSYIRVNPHRDSNASRALYEEYRTELINEAEIKKNQWFSFKAEIIGSECHFYVTDMEEPKVIFKYFEYPSGKFGFKPRLVGGTVWLDNISIKRIDDFSYSESIDTNDTKYRKEIMLDDWKVIGPFKKRISEIESSAKGRTLKIHGKQYNWTNFQTDERGCLLVGKVSRFTTDQKFTYFSTEIDCNKNLQTEIQLSSLNNLHVWVNSKYIGTIEKQKFAWYDFVENPNHSGHGLPITLDKGTNQILVLVEGGNYSGDGFFAHIKD